MEFIKAQLTKIPRVPPVDLSASTVLITGANTGIGFEAARESLYSKPQRLIIAVRDMEKGEAARAELEKLRSPTTKLDVRRLDLSSFDSVQKFAKGLEGERVDVAILNAGEHGSRTYLSPNRRY